MIMTHDHGSEFCGAHRKVCQQWGFEVRSSSKFYPHGNGKAESMVKRVKSKMKMIMLECSGIDADWDKRSLQQACWSINSTVCTLHGDIPYRVVYGRMPREKITITDSNGNPTTEMAEMAVKEFDYKDAVKNILRYRADDRLKVMMRIKRGQQIQIRNHRKRYKIADPLKLGQPCRILNPGFRKQGKTFEASTLPKEKHIVYIIEY